MKNRATRAKPSLRSEMFALHQRMCSSKSLIQTHLLHAYPPVGTLPDLRLQSNAFNAAAPKATAPHLPMSFADHLVNIDQCRGRYRDSLQQGLSAAYAACIAYWDKSEMARKENEAMLKAKCADLKIEGKSYYQLIVKATFGDDAKRASGFVHVIKVAENQSPSVPPADFIAWLTSKGGIQAVRTKYNSNGTEKTTTTPSPADTTAENISKAKDSILNASVAKIPYGQLPEIAQLGNEGDGLAILRQQADGSVVVKLVLNDSKIVDKIYAAHGRTLK